MSAANELALPPGSRLMHDTCPIQPERAGPPAGLLDPERIATLFRVPPWICANIDGSSWGPLRRLSWRIRYWTWRP